MSITTRQFLKEFQAIIDFCGSERKAGKVIGVSHSFINAVRDGKRLPGPKILKFMKLEPVKEINYRYERV